MYLFTLDFCNWTKTMHVQYYVDSDSFEKAWISLGAAFSKILVAGMDSSTRSPHEEAIISALCCSERFLPLLSHSSTKLTTFPKVSFVLPSAAKPYSLAVWNIYRKVIRPSLDLCTHFSAFSLTFRPFINRASRVLWGYGITVVQFTTVCRSFGWWKTHLMISQKKAKLTWEQFVGLPIPIPSRSGQVLIHYSVPKCGAYPLSPIPNSSRYSENQ